MVDRQSSLSSLLNPFRKEGWKLAMGLRPLELKDWIWVDEQFVDQIHLKHHLLEERHPDLFQGLPESLKGQQAVLDLLLSHLLTHFPGIYQLQASTLTNLKTDQQWWVSDFADTPLDLAGRLVQEDLLLMQPSSKGYRLTAGSLCFPSHWRLEDKIGLPLAQIHAPVPGYQQQLEHRVDHLFDRLTVDHPGWRLNWSLVDTPTLCLCCDSASPPEITAENAGDRLWLRVERQTLRRIPSTEDILFTVHTSVYPLYQITADLDLTTSLIMTLQTLPSETQIYKRVHPIRDSLLDYLHTCQGAAPKA